MTWATQLSYVSLSQLADWRETDRGQKPPRHNGSWITDEGSRLPTERKMMQNELGLYIDIDNITPTMSVVHMPTPGTRTCKLVDYIAHTKVIWFVKSKKGQHKIGNLMGPLNTRWVADYIAKPSGLLYLHFAIPSITCPFIQQAR